VRWAVRETAALTASSRKTGWASTGCTCRRNAGRECRSARGAGVRRQSRRLPARKGVLITTSDFTSDAREYGTRIEKRIVLINGTELADLLIEHGVGVTEVTSYTLKRIDSDYFDEDAD
jgi:hypothetical protein